MEDKFYIIVFEPDYNKKFPLSYPEWRVKFEKILKDMEKENIRYIHTGMDAKFFIRFYEENKENELKINLPLRLKKIGINPIYIFIPFSTLESFSIINNFKIVFDKIKENFSGMKTLYIPYMDKLPPYLPKVLKDFGIDYIFTQMDIKKDFFKYLDNEDEIRIINTSSNSKIKFMPYESVSSEIKERCFSLDEIISGIPDEGERIEHIYRNFEIKKNFDKFKKLETEIFRTHILNSVLSILNPEISFYFIENEWERFYEMFKEDKEGRIEEEIKEIEVYRNALIKDFVEDGEQYIVFNVMPFELRMNEYLNGSIYSGNIPALSFHNLEVNNEEVDFNDFKVYERGNFKFFDLHLSFRLYGKEGEIRGGLYEEEILKRNYIKTKQRIDFKDKNITFESLYIPHDKTFKLKGDIKNFNKIGLVLNYEKNYEIFNLSAFGFESSEFERIYNPYFVLKGERNYIFKTIPGSEIKLKENKIEIFFDREIYFEIKKIDEVNWMEIQKFIWRPLIFRGSFKKKINSLFEIKNKNVRFLFIDIKDSELFLWLLNFESENTKILFKDPPIEGFIYDLKAIKKIDRIQIKDKWAVVPPQKGVFCVGFNFKNLALRIF